MSEAVETQDHAKGFLGFVEKTAINCPIRSSFCS